MAELLIEVPDELAAQVAAACRATYPDQIRDAYPEGGETDAQAWRAVAAWWTADMLANYEVDRVRQRYELAVEQAQTARDQAVDATRTAAWAAVISIIAPPASPPAGGDDPVDDITASD